MKHLVVVAMISLIAAGQASAITVDGTRDEDYGTPLAVQTVETQFGDAFPPSNLGGSELDAAYARIDSGRLYLLLTGNHEPNFNKLDIFIDSVAGGENTLSETPDYDFFNADTSTWISSNLGGITFDGDLTADYHLFSRWGSGTAGYEVDFVNRSGGDSAMVPGSTATSDPAVDLIAIGAVPAGSVGPNASGTALTQSLEFAINNNNADGVFGGTAAADQVAAAAVTTGMEFSIALADLGNPAPGSTIKISALINNSNHDFLSNQFLGGLPPDTGNLAGTNPDLNSFAGDQFFSITVPGVPGITGDYNGDGRVDAADYVVWRKNDGTQNGYDDWRANFGAGTGSGAASGLRTGAVPEPVGFLLATTAAAAMLSLRRRT